MITSVSIGPETQLGDGVTTLETISSLPAVFSALNSVWIDVPSGQCSIRCFAVIERGREADLGGNVVLPGVAGVAVIIGESDDIQAGVKVQVLLSNVAKFWLSSNITAVVPIRFAFGQGNHLTGNR